MGNFFSRKKNNVARLETIKQRIDYSKEHIIALEEQKQRTLLFFSSVTVGLYVILMFIFFCFCPISRQMNNPFQILIIVSSPIIIICFRKVIKYIIDRRIRTHKKKLAVLMDEKSKILEAIKNQEEFKNTLDLLQKYGNISINFTDVKEKETHLTVPKTINSQKQKDDLSLIPKINSIDQTNDDVKPDSKAISTKKQSVLEKLMDLIVGEPSHQAYLPITCRQCFRQNGLVSKSYFNSTAFQCTYCGYYNAAIQKKMKSPSINTTQNLYEHSGSDTETSQSSDECDIDEKNNLDDSVSET